jgi:catechol 2,3-dioxygenase-like lactoylglutathione lyase family enzyme
MTQTGGFIPATRRPGVLGVHSVRRLTMTVPDVEVARRFYSDFGLDTVAQGNSLEVSIQGHAAPCITIADGPRKRVHHLSLAAFEDDIPRFTLHLKECGVERLVPPPGFESNGLWFRDPDGMLVEICVAPKTTPDRKTPALWPAGIENSARAPSRHGASKTPPTRMSHVLFFTPEVDRAVKFYTQVIGLRLSDRAGDEIAFMHGVHGSDHHLIAFVKSDGPGLHHCSFDVPSLEAVGLGAKAMADKGHERGWGMGRHVLGSNYFHYVRDPWGSYAEYSCDMDFVAADYDWEAHDNKAEDAFYVWGPTPPADFARNYEVGEA